MPQDGVAKWLTWQIYAQLDPVMDKKTLDPFKNFTTPQSFVMSWARRVFSSWARPFWTCCDLSTCGALPEDIRPCTNVPVVGPSPKILHEFIGPLSRDTASQPQLFSWRSYQTWATHNESGTTHNTHIFWNATTANMHITYDTLVYGSTHTGVNIYIYIYVYICVSCIIQNI